MKFAATIEYSRDAAKIQELRPGHREYLGSLMRQGKLSLSGPLVDDSGALIVYEAASQEEAEQLIKADPFCKAGIFLSWSIRPWNLIFANRDQLPPAPPAPPDPMGLFADLSAYQRTLALKGAIRLEVFTHIDDGATSAAEIAQRAGANERGMRILCDFLTVTGQLTKQGAAYGLTPSSKVFLSKRSPAYMGSIANFLAHPHHIESFMDVEALVKKGGTLASGVMALHEDDWIEFARSMVPMVRMVAGGVADNLGSKPVAKVLDISAGPGAFGIAVALKHPTAQITALDSAGVLEISMEHAREAGVGDRYHPLPGSAFVQDFGTGYDLILVPNFIHHFDRTTNITLLRKVHSALVLGGRVAVVEFVPNEDRVTPPMAASFSFMMLGGTAAGDAYTFKEIASMLKEAGFADAEQRKLEPTPQTLIVASA